jgi:hypothetical protein
MFILDGVSTLIYLISIPRLGIPRLQPGDECGVIRGRSRYYREPPAPAGGGSTQKIIYKSNEYSRQLSLIAIVME